MGTAIAWLLDRVSLFCAREGDYIDGGKSTVLEQGGSNSIDGKARNERWT